MWQCCQVLPSPYVANQAHKSVRADLKLSPGFHTVNNQCNISSVHDCHEMGDMSVEYLCKTNHMSKDTASELLRLAIHQNL